MALDIWVDYYFDIFVEPEDFIYIISSTSFITNLTSNTNTTNSGGYRKNRDYSKSLNGRMNWMKIYIIAIPRQGETQRKVKWNARKFCGTI